MQDPISVTPPNTSMVTNQHIAFINHITRHHTYFKNTHVHIQVFHILHNHTMQSLQAFKSIMVWNFVAEKSLAKTGSLVTQNSSAKTDSLVT